MKFLSRLLLAGVFFSTQYTFAAPELTQEQFIKLYVQKLKDSKNIESFVNGTEQLTTNQKAIIIKWAKSKGVDKINFKDVTTRSADILLTSTEGEKTKITITDFKRGVIHINDKPIANTNKKITAENLEAIFKMLNEKKTAQFHFIPRAEAAIPLIYFAWLALIAIVGLIAANWGDDPEDITEQITEIMKKNHLKGAELNCQVALSGPNVPDQFSVTNDGIEAKFYVYPDDGDESYMIEAQEHPRGFKWHKTETFKIGRNGATTSSGVDEADGHDITTSVFMAAAKKCCNLKGCAEAFRKNIPSLTREDGTPVYTDGTSTNRQKK